MSMIGPNESWRKKISMWQFDEGIVARSIGECDILICLNQYWSPTPARLGLLLRPQHRVGFFSDFSMTTSLSNSASHVADRLFSLASVFSPELRIENFLQKPLVAARFGKHAEKLRLAISRDYKVLTVHADTAPEKMWRRGAFRDVLDEFLSSHEDFVCCVLGARGDNLDSGVCGDRVLPMIPLPLPVSIGFVGLSDLFLGVDSCMLHSADLHKVPGVGLFGPTDPGVWGFRFSLHQHVRSGTQMSEISKGCVTDALEQVFLCSQERAGNSTPVRCHRH